MFGNNYLEIELLTECDQKCIFCGENILHILNNSVKNKKKRCISEQEKNKNYEKIKDKLIKNRQSFDGIIINGNDCTSSKFLPGILKFAKKNNYKNIKIITPGGVFNDLKKMQEIVSLGLTSVIITLCGFNSKTHDSITLKEGSFERVIKGIKYLKKHNIYIEINIPLIKQTLKNIFKLVRLLNFLKVDHINLFIWYPNKNRRGYYNYLMPDFTNIIKYLKGIKRGIYNLNNFPPCLNPNSKIFEIHFSGLNNGVKKYMYKYDFCKKCSRSDCLGVYDLYAKSYGLKEFKL